MIFELDLGIWWCMVPSVPLTLQTMHNQNLVKDKTKRYCNIIRMNNILRPLSPSTALCLCIAYISNGNYFLKSRTVKNVRPPPGFGPGPPAQYIAKQIGIWTVCL